MIEEWILCKLEPLKGAPLIILRDPQRMIVPGALVVDGWAEENGYTAPFCHGNLALREIYEPIRDDPDVKILLVDRSRQLPRRPLFYPDLSVAARPENRITVTLHQYLVETTGDSHWPPDVNDRVLSGRILKHLDGVLRAHGQLREISPGRFTDTDFHKILMGAVLGINPFRQLTVDDIRRIGFERYAGLTDLQFHEY